MPLTEMALETPAPRAEDRQHWCLRRAVPNECPHLRRSAQTDCVARSNRAV